MKTTFKSWLLAEANQAQCVHAREIIIFHIVFAYLYRGI